MLTQTFGRLRQETQNRRGVRFERVYDYRPDELWAAITETEQIRGWLGDAVVDLERGDGSLRFEDGQVASLRVRRLEPERLVEYDWDLPGEPTSVLRLELEAQDRGTLLVLDHRRLAEDDAVDYGAGWHAHLDALEQLLVGGSVAWKERFQELRPAYAERSETLPQDAEVGELKTAGERGDLHHRRVIAVPIDAVWAALTEPDQVQAWMGADAVRIEPRRGGTVEVRWGDAAVTGEITDWEPPRALEYTWHERDDRGRVRFELEDLPAGTVLTFDHSGIPVSALVGMSAGWHAHLDWLRAHLAGDDFEFWPRYRELRPVYEDAIDATKSGSAYAGP